MRTGGGVMADLKFEISEGAEDGPVKTSVTHLVQIKTSVTHLVQNMGNTLGFGVGSEFRRCGGNAASTDGERQKKERSLLSAVEKVGFRFISGGAGNRRRGRRCREERAWSLLRERSPGLEGHPG